METTYRCINRDVEDTNSAESNFERASSTLGDSGTPGAPSNNSCRDSRKGSHTADASLRFSNDASAMPSTGMLARSIQQQGEQTAANV